ncbi:unnamed protein product [Lymnaea stagnalis]|uniref:Uncharacterized protein n=1 Tax=Lymnaea stagnalis TaxID=6523 RepID=A0AAV2I4C3_LYMST
MSKQTFSEMRSFPLSSTNCHGKIGFSSGNCHRSPLSSFAEHRQSTSLLSVFERQDSSFSAVGLPSDELSENTHSYASHAQDDNVSDGIVPSRCEHVPCFNMSSRFTLDLVKGHALDVSSRPNLESHCSAVYGRDVNARRNSEPLCSTVISPSPTTPSPTSSNSTGLEDSLSVSAGRLSESSQISAGLTPSSIRPLPLLASANCRGRPKLSDSRRVYCDSGSQMSSLYSYGPRSSSESHAINLSISENNENVMFLSDNQMRVIQDANNSFRGNLQTESRGLTCRAFEDRISISTLPRNITQSKFPVLTLSSINNPDAVSGHYLINNPDAVSGHYLINNPDAVSGHYLINNTDAVSGHYLTVSPSHLLHSSFIYPQRFPQNQMQLIIPSGDKTYEILGQQKRCEKSYETNEFHDQSRSSTDAKYFKRRLSRNYDEKLSEHFRPFEFLHPMDQQNSDTGESADRVCDGDDASRPVNSQSGRHVEKPTPIVFSPRTIINQNMSNLDLSEPSLQSDIHYNLPPQSSRNWRIDSSDSAMSRRNGEEHTDISVWRPY